MYQAGSRWLILILLVALLVRCAAAVYWDRCCGGEFFFGDSETYWELAQSIAEGEDYRYGRFGAIFRAPGYPLVLSGLMWMGGTAATPLGARLLGAVLGTVTVWELAWLGRLLCGRRAGLTAAAIAAVYPGAVLTSVLVLSEAPFGAVLPLHLGLFVYAFRSESLRHRVAFALAAGLAAGAAVLIRPSWLLFIPFVAFWGILLPGTRRRHLVIALAGLLGMAVVMCPWWGRNYQLTGRVVLTTLQVGPSLYDGWNPQADGSSRMDFMDRVIREESHRAAPGTTDIEIEQRIDRRLRNEALDWAKSHPDQAIRLAAVKALRFWNPLPNEPTLRNAPPAVAAAIAYLALLVLALVGTARTARLGWPYWILWLPAVYFTLLHCVFVSSLRYRQPAMLGLIVLAAAALSCDAVIKARNGTATDPGAPFPSPCDAPPGTTDRTQAGSMDANT